MAVSHIIWTIGHTVGAANLEQSDVYKFYIEFIVITYVYLLLFSEKTIPFLVSVVVSLILCTLNRYFSPGNLDNRVILKRGI